MAQIAMDETTSRRPVLINYKSTLLRALTTTWRLWSLLLSSGRESQTVSVPLLESYVRETQNGLSQIVLTLSTNKVQTYSALLEIAVHFHGYIHLSQTDVFHVSLVHHNCRILYRLHYVRNGRCDVVHQRGSR
jgi:Putative adipose-regulatory protein (Seipin)